MIRKHPRVAGTPQGPETSQFVPESVRSLEKTLEELECEKMRLDAECAKLQAELQQKRALDQRALLTQEQEFCDLEEELRRLKAYLRDARAIHAQLVAEQARADETVRGRLVNAELEKYNQWLQKRVTDLTDACEATLRQNEASAAAFEQQMRSLEQTAQKEQHALYQRINTLTGQLKNQQAYNAAVEAEIRSLQAENDTAEAEITQKRARAEELRQYLKTEQNMGLEAKNDAVQALLREKQRRLGLYNYIGDNRALVAEIRRQITDTRERAVGECYNAYNAAAQSINVENARGHLLSAALDIIVARQRMLCAEADSSQVASYEIIQHETNQRASIEQLEKHLFELTEAAEAEMFRVGALSQAYLEAETQLVHREQRLAQMDADALRKEVESEAIGNAALEKQLSLVRDRIAPRNQ